MVKAIHRHLLQIKISQLKMSWVLLYRETRFWLGGCIFVSRQAPSSQTCCFCGCKRTMEKVDLTCPLSLCVINKHSALIIEDMSRFRTCWELLHYARMLWTIMFYVHENNCMLKVWWKYIFLVFKGMSFWRERICIKLETISSSPQTSLFFQH